VSARDTTTMLNERALAAGKINGFIRPMKKKSGVVFHAYGRESGKQKFVGSFGTEEEAKRALDLHHTQQLAPSGCPVRFRVVAVYMNGVEQDLQAIDARSATRDYDHSVSFQTDDEEFFVGIARRPLITANASPVATIETITTEDAAAIFAVDDEDLARRLLADAWNAGVLDFSHDANTYAGVRTKLVKWARRPTSSALHGVPF
jgi:hypothetical protein